MSADKYPNIFSRQTEAIDYIPLAVMRYQVIRTFPMERLKDSRAKDNFQ